MKRFFVLLALVLVAQQLQAMEYNTYHGVPITRETIGSLSGAPEQELYDSVRAWLGANNEFISQFTTMPHPLTPEVRKAHKQHLIDIAQRADGMQSMSKWNHILRPADARFVVQINNWHRLLAHLVYVTGQGDVTKEEIDGSKLDWKKIEDVPRWYMTISRVAVGLRLKEAQEKGKLDRIKPVPTFLVRIPYKKSSSVCDENYVAVQPYIPGVVALKDLPVREQAEFVNGMTPEFMQEVYDGTRAAGLWDMLDNIGVDKAGNYHALDYEQTIFNYPDDFYMQGERGHLRYVHDTSDGIQRVRNRLSRDSETNPTPELAPLVNPEQLERWNRIVEGDRDFVAECAKHIVVPSILLEKQHEQRMKEKKK